MPKFHALCALALLLLCGCGQKEPPPAAPPAPDPTSPHTFRAALESGDTGAVLRCLAAGARLNEKLHGEYPLFIAAKTGRTELLAALLDRGADPAVKDVQDCTALHFAASAGVAGLLIGKGVEVDGRNLFRETPLLRASDAGLVDVVDLLLSKGADVRARAFDMDVMPLNFAANEAVAGRLVAAGAPVWGEYHPHWRNTPPILTASMKGRAGVVAFLLRSEHPTPPPVIRNEYLSKALFIAVQGRHSAVAAAILEGWPYISPEEADRLLAVAVENADRDTVSVFLSKAPPSPDGHFEALIRAASLGDAETLGMILDAGGLANAANAIGFTPLHAAARKPGGAKTDAGHLACLKLLLDHGADAKAATAVLLQTPLHMAAAANFKEGAELLIKSGADVNARDQAGATPLHWAVAGDARATAALLLSRGAVPTTATTGPMAAVTAPGEEGAEPAGATGTAGATPLSLARSEEMKALLIKSMAPPPTPAPKAPAAAAARTPGRKAPAATPAAAQPKAKPAVPVSQIRVGSSEAQVIAALGEPKGRLEIGRRTVLNYDGGDITIVDGKVAAITPRK